MAQEREVVLNSNAWPCQEARKLLERCERDPDGRPEKGYVLLETGYGPSGLPHIGTLMEVVRTTMVRQAFTRLSNIPTRLFAFSDDMDGLRRVPDNIPNAEMVTRHLDKPLTSIPDPFGTHESFGHHNNARLVAFLDEFGLEYELQSSTACYKSGQFDATLLKVLEKFDDVLAVILPTLGAERQATYSPFLPICPNTGRVLQVPVVERDVAAGTITYRDENGELKEVPVTGGHCKLQWRPDWAMRWVALDVDYEMSGKDLIDSVRLSSKICRILGGHPPEGFTYELFLDEQGEKISKSKGNGLAVEDWLSYAPRESLAHFMYAAPRRAKRLYFDVIPRQADDYLSNLDRFGKQPAEERLDNPVWHIHDGAPPQENVPLSFSLLLNLASVCNTEDSAVLWGFVFRYAPDARPETHPILDGLIGYALAYYRDFVKPTKRYRAPTAMEVEALSDLVSRLRALPADAEAERIQNELYEVGKGHPFPDLRTWFRSLYEVFLGQSQGPRMGSFIALYGLTETVDLVRRVIDGEVLGEFEDRGTQQASSS